MENASVAKERSIVVVTASEAKQSPAQAWRLLLSQRTLHRNDNCERSEAVSHLGMKIASVAKSAPSLLSLRAKRSSLPLRHGDCFYRKECSIATTARLLLLRAKQSTAQAWGLLLLQRTLHRNDSSVIVTASEAKQSPAQAWGLLLSQRTLHRNDSSVVVTASEAKQSPAQAWRLLLSQRTLHRNDSSVVVAASEAKQSPAQAWRLLLS